MKVATIVGARPQFIKASVVSRQIARHSSIHECIIHTGQHFDDNMSGIFFREIGIPKPSHSLNISGGPHGQMTGRQLEAIEKVLMTEKVDCVMVYGDTNSTLAGALAAAKMSVPVAHVEAGLRSFNRAMPEEVNRIATDHVSDLLFAPSQTAIVNLEREGIAGSMAINVGDVMYDAALLFAAAAWKNSSVLRNLSLEAGRFRLATVHRQENVDDPDRLSAIFAALRALARDMRMVLPLHPRTRKSLELRCDFDAVTEGIDVIKPVGLFDIISLLKGARSVLTDSGGLQKEAYFHGTPVTVLRNETEWVELVEVGWAELAPPVDELGILAAVDRLEAGGTKSLAFPYGRGDASEKIVATLASRLS